MTRISRAMQKLRHRRVARLLQRQAGNMNKLSPAHASALRDQARAVHAAAAQVICAADLRLGDAGSGAWISTLPPRVDWVHRPAVWTTPQARSTQASAANEHNLGDGVSLHYDGEGAIDLRQIDAAQSGQSQHALVLDINEHSGSFVSLAIGFPDSALANFSKSVLFRCDLKMDRPARLDVFARLNLRHGPNVEKVIRAVEPTATAVDFDVYYADLNAEDVTDIWVDLIINSPGPTRIVINDLLLSRRPRADV